MPHMTTESDDLPELATVGERLRYARERKGKVWTQAHLATVSGVGLSTVGMIEAGHRVSKGSLPALAEALGVRHKWLLSGEPPWVEPLPQHLQDLDKAIAEGKVTMVPVGTAKVRRWIPNDPERLVRQFEGLLLKLPEANRLAAANAAYQAMIPYILDQPTPEQEPPGQ